MGLGGGCPLNTALRGLVLGQAVGASLIVSPLLGKPLGGVMGWQGTGDSQGWLDIGNNQGWPSIGSDWIGLTWVMVRADLELVMIRLA